MSCVINYTVSSQWNGGFVAGLTITNTGSTTISGWTVTFVFADGQRISGGWNGKFTQSGAQVSISDVGYNAQLAPGASTTPGFFASWNESNSTPPSFTLNGSPCH
jgi:rhamnogalacturonan endolyase